MPQEISKSRPVERSKFQFPAGYSDHKIVALTRDPWWIFAYWEIDPKREDGIKKRISDSHDFPERSILRIYDVTNISFNGKNAHSFFDIELKGLASSWYINVGQDRSWIVDIGIVTRNGDFYLLARSNEVKTPRFSMSDQLDAEWMIQEDDYWKMFGLSGGFGAGKASLEMREMMKKRIEEQITSGGISSSASFYRKPEERKFWLVVNCELIVYGATEPNAKVKIQGKDVQLRPDGTFSLRFALPDGEQIVPVEAISADNIDKKCVTPVVKRITE